MNKAHCNICDRTPAHNTWRVWPNTLEKNDRLRNVSLDVKIAPPRHTEDMEFDLCESCFTKVLEAVALTRVNHNDR